jgi:hypothetical protein
MNNAVCLTVTEINCNIMDLRSVEDAEVLRASKRERTWGTTMPKLDAKTQSLKCNCSKKMTIPNVMKQNKGAEDTPRHNGEDR